MTSLLEDIDASIAEVNNALKDSTTHLPIIACGSALHYLKQLRKKAVIISEQLVSYKKDNQNEMLNGNIPQLMLAINALNVALELVGEPKDNKPSSG